MFYVYQILKKFFTLISQMIWLRFQIKEKRMGRKGTKTKIKENLIRTISELKFNTRKTILNYQGPMVFSLKTSFSQGQDQITLRVK